MARKLRIQYEGAIYHVMNRGDRREAIFLGDEDRWSFLETFGEACERTGWQPHALCLMDNHFHLVVKTPGANLVDGMKWLLGTYTNRFNRRHEQTGHLFGGRYKALLVDGKPEYFHTVCDYVHLNPVRARLLKPGDPGASYPWSSLPEYAKPPTKRWPWLRVDRLMGCVGIPKDSTAGRRVFARKMEERRAADDPESWAKVRRGWCLGDEDFRRELLERVDGGFGAAHYGSERKDSQMQRAERIIAEELKSANWPEVDLPDSPTTHPVKANLAVRLRRETTQTSERIARRLHMGAKSTAFNLVYATRRSEGM